MTTQASPSAEPLSPTEQALVRALVAAIVAELRRAGEERTK